MKKGRFMNKRSKLLVGLTAALVALTVASGVAVAAGWHVVTTRSASGDFAATAADASVSHPHHIAVRFTGGSGLVAWACDKEFSVSSWSRNLGAGFHELPHVAGKDSCDVTASVGGSRYVSVKIYTRR